MIFLLLLLLWLGFFSASAGAVLLNLNAPPILSIEDDSGPFTLTFPDFLQGSQSSPQAVTYRLRANHMSPGLLPAAVSARLGEAFDHADLEADVQDYRNLGTPNFATLQEAQNGSRTVETADTPLADKHPGHGAGDRCLDGQLTVTWRATLKRDAPAGTQSRSLIVTLRDGN